MSQGPKCFNTMFQNVRIQYILFQLSFLLWIKSSDNSEIYLIYRDLTEVMF